MNLHLIGGPFDGANGPKAAELETAETIWAKIDPMGVAKNGLWLTWEERKGYERYDYFKTHKRTDFYVHDCLPVDLIRPQLRESAVFHAPSMDPVEMFEQMRREVPQELWDEWFTR